MSIISRILIALFGAMILFVFMVFFTDFSNSDLDEKIVNISMVPGALALVSVAFFTDKNAPKIISLILFLVGLALVFMTGGMYIGEPRVSYFVVCILGFVTSVVASLMFFNWFKPVE